MSEDIVTLIPEGFNRMTRADLRAHIKRIDEAVKYERTRYGRAADLAETLANEVRRAESLAQTIVTERHKIGELKNEISRLNREVESGATPQQLKDLRFEYEEEIRELKAGLTKLAREALDYV